VSAPTDAVRRVAEGECVIDPTIVARLMARRRDSGPLTQLTDREREVLALMTKGHSNQGICTKLFLSPKTVEAHVSQIFPQPRTPRRTRRPPPGPRRAHLPARSIVFEKAARQEGRCQSPC
jgi:DNA-binding NarL/FixJ family response regulator